MTIEHEFIVRSRDGDVTITKHLSREQIVNFNGNLLDVVCEENEKTVEVEAAARAVLANAAGSDPVALGLFHAAEGKMITWVMAVETWERSR